jgi:hypothetical protein
MNQGPRWTLLMKKTRAVKSRATVPLKDIQYLARDLLVSTGLAKRIHLTLLINH